MDGGGKGLGTDLCLLMSRKLARGGRSLTPERVEPSMAFWSFLRRKQNNNKKKGLETEKQRLETTRKKRQNKMFYT